MWTKFVGDKQNEMIIPLRQRVAFRYCTVNLIDLDNRMQEFGDEHPQPNIDIRSIVFEGAIIPSKY